MMMSPGPAATVRAVEAGVTPAWIYVVGVLVLALALLFIALHLTGTSLTHHYTSIALPLFLAVHVRDFCMQS